MRRSIALYLSCLDPDVSVGNESESSMDGFMPCKGRNERRRSKLRKDKTIVIYDDAADGRYLFDDLLGDYLKNGQPIDLDELLNLVGYYSFCSGQNIVLI